MFGQNIQVAVRCRPLNEREKRQNNNATVIECREKKREIVVYDKSSSNPSSTKTFTFDNVFGVNSKQADVYQQLVRPVVNEVVQGYNCTLFAYGQTGTGKTYTMEGESSSMECVDIDDPMIGIIPRAISQLFSALNAMTGEFKMKISFVELYNEELTDLLDSQNIDKNLKIYDDPDKKGSINIPNLLEVTVKTKAEVYKWLQQGSEKRRKGSTNMNDLSSRSHSVFSVTVVIKEKIVEGDETVKEKVGKLNLVDLAGSENIERSGASGKRATEAGKINKSLTTLGRVITSLVENSSHIPYRESNLTRMLQDSLGGKTKTTIIATISPAQCNLEETLSTLDYAYKAKSIKNKPEINQRVVKMVKIKEFTEEIDQLKRDLAAARDKHGHYLTPETFEEMESTAANQKEEIRNMSQQINALLDEIQKNNEYCENQKCTLEESNSRLIYMERILYDSQQKLDALKMESEETTYLLEIRKDTESRLFKQANYIIGLYEDAQMDNGGLQDKLTRLNTMLDDNRQAVNKFSAAISDATTKMSQYELQMSQENRHRMASLLESFSHQARVLNEFLEVRLTSQLNLIAQKQTQRLNEQSTIIENELKSPLNADFLDFSKKLASNAKQSGENVQLYLALSNTYKSDFDKQSEKLTSSIQTLEKDKTLFMSQFGESGNEFLIDTCQKMTTNGEILSNGFGKLVRSVDKHRDEIKALQQEKTRLSSNMNKMEESFTQMFQLFASMKTQSSDIDERLDKLQTESGHLNEQVFEMKDLVKEQETRSITDLHQTYETCVNAPIKALLESNAKTILEIEDLSKSLDEKNDLSHSHFKNSIQCFTMLENEQNAQLDRMINGSLKCIENGFAKLEANIESNRKEVEDLVGTLINKTIKEEKEQILQLVENSSKITTDAKFSLENLNQACAEFYEKNIRSVNDLTNNDLKDDVPTGKTPKRKLPEKRIIDLPKTRPHEELLAEFRQNRLEFKIPTVKMESMSSASSLVSLDYLQPNAKMSRNDFGGSTRDMDNLDARRHSPNLPTKEGTKQTKIPTPVKTDSMSSASSLMSLDTLQPNAKMSRNELSGSISDVENLDGPRRLTNQPTKLTKNVSTKSLAKKPTTSSSSILTQRQI